MRTKTLLPLLVAIVLLLGFIAWRLAPVTDHSKPPQPVLNDSYPAAPSVQ